MKSFFNFGKSFATVKISCIYDHEHSISNLNEKLEKDFGLSYVIDIDNGASKILFDFGTRWEVLKNNADEMGIDLSDVNIAVLSHMHFDHGGALQEFLTYNKNAVVVMNNNGFDENGNVRPYYSKRTGSVDFIGINFDSEKYREQTLRYPELNKDMSTLLFFQEKMMDPEEFEIFELPLLYPLEHELPKGTNHLMKMDVSVEGNFVQDDFSHEQSLLIRGIGDSEKVLLICGCSHNGVLNIIDSSRYALFDCEKIDYVVGGFHLGFDKDQNYDYIANELLEKTETCYTGHCTGMYAFEELENRMGKDRIQYFGLGDEIVVEL